MATADALLSLTTAPTAALHLHRGAPPAPRVVPLVRDQGARPTRTSGRRPRSPTRLHPHGRAGALGLSYPEEHGGQGGDYYCNLVLTEEIVHSNCGGLAMGVTVHTGIATPPVHLFRTRGEEAGRPSSRRLRARKISVPFRLTEPDAGSDIYSIKTRASANDDHRWLTARRPTSRRPPGGPIVLVTKTDPVPATAASRSSSSTWTRPAWSARRSSRSSGCTPRTRLLAFQDVAYRRRGPGTEGRVGHVMWELQSERPDQRRRLRRRERAKCFDKTLQYATRSERRSDARSAAPARSAASQGASRRRLSQAARSWRERPPSTSTTAASPWLGSLDRQPAPRASSPS